MKWLTDWLTGTYSLLYFIFMVVCSYVIFTAFRFHLFELLCGSELHFECIQNYLPDYWLNCLNYSIKFLTSCNRKCICQQQAVYQQDVKWYLWLYSWSVVPVGQFLWHLQEMWMHWLRNANFSYLPVFNAFVQGETIGNLQWYLIQWKLDWQAYVSSCFHTLSACDVTLQNTDATAKMCIIYVVITADCTISLVDTTHCWAVRKLKMILCSFTGKHDIKKDRKHYSKELRQKKDAKSSAMTLQVTGV